MDLSQVIAGSVAIFALALPSLALLVGGARRLAAVQPRIPSSRFGGAVVLCAALGGLARGAPAISAVAPVTSRIAQTPPTAKTSESEPQPRATETYVVRPGDSLWAIACRHLQASGAPTTDAAIDRMWRTIYAANRQVVGEDPDLIYPGTQLTIPEERA
ncbi:MAG: LysM domain-containing protein [Acidimicrobiia bacterium]